MLLYFSVFFWGGFWFQCIVRRYICFLFVVARPPDPFKFMPYSTMVSIRLSSRVDKFLVLWCVQQVRFLVPVIRELMDLVRAHWNLEFLLYSRLVFVLPATCTTTKPFGGAHRRPHHRQAVQSHYLPFCRQTLPGAELSGPVWTPHLVVAFQLFFGGRRPVAR